MMQKTLQVVAVFEKKHCTHLPDILCHEGSCICLCCLRKACLSQKRSKAPSQAACLLAPLRLPAKMIEFSAHQPLTAHGRQDCDVGAETQESAVQGPLRSFGQPERPRRTEMCDMRSCCPVSGSAATWQREPP